jgi:hypothetical protein
MQILVAPVLFWGRFALICLAVCHKIVNLWHTGDINPISQDNDVFLQK